jgi:hypothetical protein
MAFHIVILDIAAAAMLALIPFVHPAKSLPCKML